MNAPLKLVPHNLHTLRVDDRQMLFHVPTCSLFEMDALCGEVLQQFAGGQSMQQEQVIQTLEGRYGAEAVTEAVTELRGMAILSDGLQPPVEIPEEVLNAHELNTLVLNVNTGCNLACSYCYKADVTRPELGEKMDLATARQGVDLLFRESPDQSRFNLVFFGGEPLSNLPLIRQVVEYAEALAVERGKQISFSLTTNATLLSDAVIDYLDRHKFGVTISIDGPQPYHDRNRVTTGGRGSYAAVAARTRRLLQRYRARPVGARVTLTHGVTDINGIWNHLYGDLGFHEVGFAPVTSSDKDDYNLSQMELEEVFTGFKALGRQYLQAALSDRRTGFSNLQRLLADLHQGRKKVLPCGAGVSLLAVDNKGELNLCHRFTGSDMRRFGDVRTGVDRQGISQVLARRLDRTGRECDTCRIRNLCGGGCYHESLVRYEDLHHPVDHYCELLRDWIDFGLEIYTTIMNHDPAFFDHPNHQSVLA